MPQADEIVAAAQDRFELLVSEDGRPFVRGVEGKDSVGAYPVRSRALAERLQILGREVLGQYPRSEVLSEAVHVLAATATHEGAQVAIARRGAQHNGAVYIDLDDKTGRVVKVTDSGWDVEATCPIAFARTGNSRPLPEPRRGGDLALLSALVRLDPDEMLLLVAFLVSALVGEMPYPVLVVHGEQGSGKSTLTHIAKSLVDPGGAPLRAAPRTQHDLAITAENNLVVAFDNLSGFPGWLSDALCRLSTGGGWSTRELYTTDQERVFEHRRPILLNGIDAVAGRGDLLDRAIVLTLDRPSRFMDEATIWQTFAELHPLLLGCLLDLTAGVLRHRANVADHAVGRLADFERLGAAIDLSVGADEQRFRRAYALNRDETLKASLDHSMVARILTSYMEHRHEGIAMTPTELYVQLTQHAGGQRGPWPTSPATMGRELRRVTQALRRAGTKITYGSSGRGVDKERLIEVTHERAGDGGDGGVADVA